ncbi:MAG: hypothetical protein A2284_04210 [Deltaproteobacteria bacterium RIFOXYA12_FULL_61_11]|nr:MAG: hypothetical protein A2284_04210 [Deltaproteobacteria bacterium RIFOXYA12_FULL_61_11]
MSNNKLYVGNLNYSTTKEDLMTLCSQFGPVVEIKHFENKGFAFVEFENEEAAEQAKAALDHQEFMGRNLRVDEAQPPQKREGGSRGGWGRGGERGNDRGNDRNWGNDRGGNDRNWGNNRGGNDSNWGNDRNGNRGGNDRGCY